MFTFCKCFATSILPPPDKFIEYMNVSADFILRKKSKLYYAEGKTLNGKNSLDNRLKKGARQAERVLVDVIGTNDTNYLSATLKAAFEQQTLLNEVVLLKGGRLIKVSRQDATSKKFAERFRKIWNKQK